MQLAIHHWPAPLGISNIEEVRIGAAREAGAQDATHCGTRSVTSGEVLRLANLLTPIGPFHASEHASTTVLEAEELGLALDHHALSRQLFDQKALVLVLRKDQHVRERAHTLADVTEVDTRHLLAPSPKVRDREL